MRAYILADNAVTVTLRFGDGGEESFSGTYAQSGHLGRIADGEFSVDFGTISVSEIEIRGSGFTGRFAGDLLTSRWHDWCNMDNGRIGGCAVSGTRSALKRAPDLRPGINQAPGSRLRFRRRPVANSHPSS